jgi:hypothetical protein
VPWQVYQDLLRKTVAKKLFGENANKKEGVCGRKIGPVAIKLLGALRILGCNWIFMM